MATNKTDMTTKELIAYVDALSSAVATQQQINRRVYERIEILEKAAITLGDTQVRILDIMAGDLKTDETYYTEDATFDLVDDMEQLREYLYGLDGAIVDGKYKKEYVDTYRNRGR